MILNMVNKQAFVAAYNKAVATNNQSTIQKLEHLSDIIGVDLPDVQVSGIVCDHVPVQSFFTG
jgi:hypothetical protein